VRTIVHISNPISIIDEALVPELAGDSGESGAYRALARLENADLDVPVIIRIHHGEKVVAASERTG
jgi:hypothetical protein